MTEGIRVVLPRAANGKMACAVGTRFYQGDKEIKDVSSFSLPLTEAGGILCVTLTIPVTKIEYEDEATTSARQIQEQLAKFRK